MSRSQELVIPVDGKELGAFILSLLGQPRTIERNFSFSSLDVDRKWFYNLLSLLDQRLAQNEHALASFKVSIYFDNGKIVVLYDKESFLSFNDNSQLETVGIDLNVTYIVKFPNHESLVKQTIRIEIFSDILKKEVAQTSKTQKHTDRQAFVGYSIGCVDLTWGEDISRHLNAHIMTGIDTDGTPTKTYSVLASSFRFIIPAYALLSVLGSFFYFIIYRPLVVSAAKYADLQQKLKETGTSASLDSVSSRLTAYLDAITYDVFRFALVDISVWLWLRTILIGLLSLSIIYFFLCEASRKVIIVSYNDHTDGLAQRVKSRREKMTWGIYGAIIIAIITGVLAIRVDAYLFG